MLLYLSALFNAKILLSSKNIILSQVNNTALPAVVSTVGFTYTLLMFRCLKTCNTSSWAFLSEGLYLGNLIITQGFDTISPWQITNGDLQLRLTWISQTQKHIPNESHVPKPPCLLYFCDTIHLFHPTLSLCRDGGISGHGYCIYDHFNIIKIKHD